MRRGLRTRRSRLRSSSKTAISIKRKLLRSKILRRTIRYLRSCPKRKRRRPSRRSSTCRASSRIRCRSSATSRMMSRTSRTRPTTCVLRRNVIKLINRRTDRKILSPSTPTVLARLRKTRMVKLMRTMRVICRLPRGTSRTNPPCKKYSASCRLSSRCGRCRVNRSRLLSHSIAYSARVDSSQCPSTTKSQSITSLTTVAPSSTMSRVACTRA